MTLSSPSIGSEWELSEVVLRVALGNTMARVQTTDGKRSRELAFAHANVLGKYRLYINFES